MDRIIPDISAFDYDYWAWYRDYQDWMNRLFGAELPDRGPAEGDRPHVSRTGLIILAGLIASLVGAFIVSFILFYVFPKLWRRLKRCCAAPRRVCNRWQAIQGQRAALRQKTPEETHSMDELVAAEEGRKIWWRAKVKQNLARTTGDSNVPPPYASIVEPPRPVVTIDAQRYVGYNI